MRSTRIKRKRVVAWNAVSATDPVGAVDINPQNFTEDP